MKKLQSNQEGTSQGEKVYLEELSEEIIGKRLLEAISLMEINVDVKIATKRFSLQANNNGCKLETSLSLKSLVIMFLAIGGYITKKFF